MANQANAVKYAAGSLAGTPVDQANTLMVQALQFFRMGEIGIADGLKYGTRAISLMNTYAAQQAAVKQLAGGYQSVMKALGKDIVIESAIRAVQRRVKSIAGDDFTWVKSESPVAKRVAAHRNKRVSTGKKLKTGTIAPAPAPAKSWHPNAWRSELIAAIKQEVESAAVVMAPSELSQLQSLLAAFTASLAAIPVPAPAKAKSKK